MRNRLISMFMLLGLLVAVGVGEAQAQVVGEIEADIPFQFHAGNAKFPAGKYVVKMLDSSNLEVMEISTADGRNAAVFQIRDAQAKTEPSKTELVFNRYGDQYFLSELFDEGNKLGSEVLESHYERMLKKGGTTPQKHRVPGHHRAHQKKP